MLGMVSNGCTGTEAAVICFGLSHVALAELTPNPVKQSTWKELLCSCSLRGFTSHSTSHSLLAAELLPKLQLALPGAQHRSQGQPLSAMWTYFHGHEEIPKAVFSLDLVLSVLDIFCTRTQYLGLL